MANYPAIPEPTNDPNSLRDSVLALKQAFEIFSGQKGVAGVAAVTAASAAQTTAALTAGTAAVAATSTANTTAIAAVPAATSAAISAALAAQVVAVANGGTGDTGTAWTAYTPTVACSTGSFTLASATGRYKKIGKLVFLIIDVLVTTNGTANGWPLVSLPFPERTAAPFAYLVGREYAVNGSIVMAAVQSGVAAVLYYNNTYSTANGYRASLSGVYEAA